MLSRAASPFVRWTLSPFLILFAAAFIMHIPELVLKNQYDGVYGFSVVAVFCLALLLSIWGVPCMGRVVAGIIAGICTWYLVRQCIINFNGNWGWGSRKSEATPINSIIAFIAFGVPSYIYAIFGRFNLRKEAQDEDEYDGDDEFQADCDAQKSEGEQAAPRNR